MSERHIRDFDTGGPQQLSISGGMKNDKAIATWWQDAKLFVESMEDLGRVVLLLSDGEGSYYLSSVQDRMPFR